MFQFTRSWLQTKISNDLIFLSNSLNYKQPKDALNINFADHIEDRFNAITYSCGEFALQIKAWDEVLATHPIPGTFEQYVSLTAAEQESYKELVNGWILGQLIIKNCLNNRLCLMVEENYSRNQQQNSSYPNSNSTKQQKDNYRSKNDKKYNPNKNKSYFYKECNIS